MKKILLALCILAASIGFTSCENDSSDSLFDEVVGRTWVGDLGVFSRSGLPLESGITFGADGFGQDKLYYYKENGGTYYDTFRISWDWSYDAIRISYGFNAPSRELRNIYVSHGQMTGDLYIYDNAPNPFYGRVTLYMR